MGYSSIQGDSNGAGIDGTKPKLERPFLSASITAPGSKVLDCQLALPSSIRVFAAYGTQRLQGSSATKPFYSYQKNHRTGMLERQLTLDRCVLVGYSPFSAIHHFSVYAMNIDLLEGLCNRWQAGEIIFGTEIPTNASGPGPVAKLGDQERWNDGKGDLLRRVNK